MATRTVIKVKSSPNLRLLTEVKNEEHEDLEDDPLLSEIREPAQMEVIRLDIRRTASESSLDNMISSPDSPQMSESSGEASMSVEDEEFDGKAKRGLKYSGASSLNLEAMVNKTLPLSYVRKLNEMFSKASREEPLPLFRDMIEGKLLTVKQLHALNRLSLLGISPPIVSISKHMSEYGKNQPLSIQIASDLHIETFDRNKHSSKQELWKDVIKPVAPYLALLGDIGNPATEQGWIEYQRFMLYQASRFKLVLIVAGNHEYYNDSFGDEVLTVLEVKNRIKELCKSNPKLIFMDNKSIVLNGVIVIGSTLWSHIPVEAKSSVEKGVNDYHLIFLDEDKKVPAASDWIGFFPRYCKGKPVRSLKADDTLSWHRNDLDFIKKELKEAKRLEQNALILSHHTPTFQGTSNPKFRNSPIRWAFSSDLEYMFDNGKKSEYSAMHTWASGHTHWSCDQIINGVHVVSNQYGYTGTAECTYKPAFVLRI